MSVLVKGFYILVIGLIVSACEMEPPLEQQMKSIDQSAKGSITPRQMADALHTVLEVDRSVYTKLIINRLAVKEKVIKASEHWEEDKALVLPAQMFRAAAEAVLEKDEANFSFSLLSSWPLNQQNRPRTEMEKKGLIYIEQNPGENFYGEEVLGGTTFFTAIYPDVAVVEACISCHNDHKDTPKTNFKMGEVMGGVVIRIPLG